MNVREEDRQKNSCPSRGLGLAAAAIGVGVGAALYYIFSKRTENPDGEGSTTSGWTCEQPHTFEQTDDHEDSYITISENSTSDTSVHDSDSDIFESGEDSGEDSSGEDSDTPQFRFFFNISDNANEDSNSSQESSDFTSEIDDSFETNYLQTSYDTNTNVSNLELDIGMEMEWDVTASSADIPEFRMPRGPVYSNLIRELPIKDEERLRQQALYEEEQLKILREEAYRERTWSLEECSICFDIILKDQEVTTLPCTHHFHSACIAPWLQEQQTCPNCRKAAE